MAANIVKALRPDRQRVLRRRFDQVVRQDVLHQLQRLVEQQLFVDAGVLFFDHAIAAPEDVAMFADVTDIKQARLHAIVEIRCEVSNLVGEIDQLRLERRSLVEKIIAEFRMLRSAVVARVLDDAFAHAKRQVESTVRGIALLKVLDDAQRVKIMVEPAAVPRQAAVKGTLAGVAEGWMADIVNQRKRLRQILVQAKCGRDRTGDLGNLDGVGQPAAKVVGGAAGKDLRLPCQTPEGAGLHDPLAIALEGSARGTDGRWIHARQKKIVRISGDRASMEIDCHRQT